MGDISEMYDGPEPYEEEEYIEGIVLKAGEKAALISFMYITDDDKEVVKEDWFPYSACHDLRPDETKPLTIGQEVAFNCPTWLAIEKGIC